MKKIIFLLGLFWLPLGILANELSIGGQYWSWSLNVIPPGGANEFYLPVSIAVEPVTHLTLYAQTELGVDFAWNNPFYNPYFSASNSTDAGLSDTTVGGKAVFVFQAGGDLFVNLGFNLPSGSADFRNRQAYLSGEFVDVRYQAVTFGISAMAGVDLPAGSGQFTLEAGYMDPNVFNTTFGLPPGNSLYSQNSDTLLFSAAHSQASDDGSTRTISLWALYHDPLSPNFQYGPSFDFDYRLQNPKAFSLDAGGQIFLNNHERMVTISGFFPPVVNYGAFMTEPLDSRGPRLYADPSYTFGEVTVQGQVHLVFPNDYPTQDGFYDGGGWLLGLGPLWKIPLEKNSDLNLSGSFSKIIEQKAGIDAGGDRVDILTDLWRLGVDYDLRF